VTSAHIKGRAEGDKDCPCLGLAIATMQEGGPRVVRGAAAHLHVIYMPPADPVAAIESCAR